MGIVTHKQLEAMLRITPFLAHDADGRVQLASSVLAHDWTRPWLDPAELVRLVSTGDLDFNRQGTITKVEDNQSAARSAEEVAHHLCRGLPCLWSGNVTWRAGDPVGGLSVVGPYRDGSVVMPGEAPAPGTHRIRVPDSFELLAPILALPLNFPKQVQGSPEWSEIVAGGLTPWPAPSATSTDPIELLRRMNDKIDQLPNKLKEVFDG